MVYNILARSQTLPTLQYNILYVENRYCTDFVYCTDFRRCPQETARFRRW